jgi:CDP-glucose 4,6-dehydratase
MLTGKNIFVTGAGGFIGSSIVKKLVSLDANVFSLVRSKSAEDFETLKGSKIYVGDVCDYSLMSEIISTNSVDYIVHLAANAIVKNSARDPMSTYRSNVMGTVTVLEAARNVGKCTKIIAASSDKAYGDHEILPYTESTPLATRNTYDTSKACSDLIARTYAHNYGMPIVVTRCSNVYGPGDPNTSRIIPNTIARINRNEPPVLYSDVSLMEREFIYIDDVVDAYLRLMSSDETTNGEAYNIGGGGPVKITQVVNKILDLMGSRLETTVIKREPTFKEISRQYIDASKLFDATGWKQTTSLQEGLATTIQSYLARNSEKR